MLPVALGASPTLPVLENAVSQIPAAPAPAAPAPVRALIPAQPAAPAKAPGAPIKIKAARDLQETARSATAQRGEGKAGGQATGQSLNLLFDASGVGAPETAHPVLGTTARGVSRPRLGRPAPAANAAAPTAAAPAGIQLESTGPSGIKKSAQDALSRFASWAVERYPAAADRAFILAERLEGRVYASDAERAEFVKLRKSLAMHGLPAPVSATVRGEIDPARRAAAVLALPSIHKLATALEAGRQRPGDFHIVLDPAGLDIRPHPGATGTQPFIKRGVSFDENGRAVVLSYETPRPVWYYGNFLTAGAYGRPDGEITEQNLNIPQSSSLALWSVTGDKLKTRLLQAAEGAPVPKSLALLLPENPLAKEGKLAALETAQVALRRFPEGPNREAAVREEVEAFLERHAAALADEIVVKPSGRQWHSSQGVRFHSKSDVEGIVAHILELAADPKLTAADSVLLDERLSPPPLYYAVSLKSEAPALPARADRRISEGHRAGKWVRVEWLSADEIESMPAERLAVFARDTNVRVYAARGPGETLEFGGYMVRSGAWDTPTVAEPSDIQKAAVILSFEDVAWSLQNQHGLLRGPGERAAYEETLQSAGKKALKALRAYETTLSRKDGDSYKGRSDMTAVDTITNVEDGQLIPKIIEMASHDLGGQYQMDRHDPRQRGLHSRAWVATMFERADAEGAGPALDEADLAARVAAGRTTRGMSIASFKKGEYDAAYEQPLRRLGADAVSIEDPSSEEVARFQEADGYFFKPKKLRWTMKTQSVDEYLAQFSSKKRGKMRRQLRDSEALEVSVETLTPAAYREWHSLYLAEVVNREGGKEFIKADFADTLAASGKLGEWRGIFFRDQEGRMIGGALTAPKADMGSMWVIGYAAYTAEAKDKGASLRSFMEAMQYARENGYRVLSYGADTNFYGYDRSIGLAGYKIGVRMEPHPQEPFEILKVLDAAKFSEGGGQGWFFMAMKRSGAYFDRVLARLDGETGESGYALLGGGHYEEGAAHGADILTAHHFPVNEKAEAAVGPEGYAMVVHPAAETPAP